MTQSTQAVTKVCPVCGTSMTIDIPIEADQDTVEIHHRSADDHALTVTWVE